MRNKGERGVTLLALTITIIVLLIVTSIVISNGIKQLGLKKVNNLEVDIESISSKVIDYYLKNETLPVFEKKYFNNKNELETFLANKGAIQIESILNPNDSGSYYVIDLSKIDGLTLNYGERFKEWTDESITYNNLQEIYIINETSLQIYFPQGIKYANEYYFTKENLAEEIDAIGLNSGSEELDFNIINNEIENLSNNLVSVISNIQVILDENFEDDTLEYAWTTENIDNNMENLNFLKFTLDNSNNATIKSKGVENTTEKIYLWIKVLDKSGKVFYKAKEVKVILKPAQINVVDATTIFSTEYGTIDVIWLSGTSNTVTSTPNAPNLSGMTPVSWTFSGDTWTEDLTASSSYYSYEAGSGTLDNTSSRWANAKNQDGSYFVWIPRYAYRITYYSSQSSTEPTGYYDGWGQWKAEDGKLRIALDQGIETVLYQGKKYIVHPAFCGESVGYDNGSWSNNISGFWVAKYEMSRTGATNSDAGSGYETAFLSVPNVQSARYITIRNMYNVAKSYDTTKESHLMKNSEWGAVAYLTQSQFGRNGNEIDINNSSSCITGNGGGSTSASSASGTTNAYNTTTGAKASTTGNVYGVYDMSGGAWEYVAVFNNTDTNNYEASYGSSFASTAGSSDNYATKYNNTTSSYRGNSVICKYGKVGDATKEVNKGGAYALTSKTYCTNWFSDCPNLCDASSPFVGRGGFYSNENEANAGVFCSRSNHGFHDYDFSFRTVLCP